MKAVWFPLGYIQVKCHSLHRIENVNCVHCRNAEAAVSSQAAWQNRGTTLDHFYQPQHCQLHNGPVMDSFACPFTRRAVHSSVPWSSSVGYTARFASSTVCLHPCTPIPIHHFAIAISVWSFLRRLIYNYHFHSKSYPSLQRCSAILQLNSASAALSASTSAAH